MHRWVVHLQNKNQTANWRFSSKLKAEDFINDRRELVQHLGYDPDQVYLLVPVERVLTNSTGTNKIGEGHDQSIC